MKDVCCDSLRGRGLCNQEDSPTDTLFTFEKAHLVCVKFQNLQSSTITEISIMFFVRLYAGVADAVDSLGQTIEQLSNRVGNNFDSVSKVGSVQNHCDKELAQ